LFGIIIIGKLSHTGAVAKMTVVPLKKVVVFGSSGFIGGSIYNYLQGRDCGEVVGYSSADCDLLIRSDVTEILSSYGPDTSVVLCSAITRSIEDSWDVMLKNVAMIHNVTTAIPNSGLRSIILMSSVDVYGMPPKSLPVTEETGVNPIGYYGLSKIIGEALLKIKLASKCAIGILRIPGIYGAGDDFKSIIGKFIKKVVNHETILVLGEGSAKRDYVEIGDLCRVVEYFLLRRISGTVNIATGTSITINDLVTTIGELSEIGPVIEFVTRNNVPTGDLCFDTRRLKNLLNNFRFKDLESGIGEYLCRLKL
jgi:nucleoside-diphosphate-sugar epimerase